MPQIQSDRFPVRGAPVIPARGLIGKAALALAAVFALSACGSVDRGSPEIAADEAGFAPGGARQAVTAKRHMVASANPVASRIGRDILRKGGSALDAAIAMQAVLTLVEPQSSGIGGGGFLMHFDGKSGRIDTYEGRESAPRSVKETLFMAPDGKPMERERYEAGGIAAAVPGSLRLLAQAHRRHGRLPWPDLFQPAIDLAERGFKVSPRLHASIKRDPYLREYAAARAYFYTSAGEPKPVGNILKNPDLAATLKAVATDGIRALHFGPIAKDIADAVRGDNRRPGQMTERDLGAYRAKVRPPLCGPYREWLICGFGPPTSGGIATIMTLALLERFDLATLAPSSAEAVHLISEATKLANADRLHYVADPDFVNVPVSGLLDRGYLERRSRLIEPAKAMAKVRPGSIPMLARNMPLATSDDEEHLSTTHLSAADSQGNTVAMTSSVGSAFGSRILVRGFILNNHATDFSIVPRSKSGRPKANRPGGGKRPRSSQAPTLVFDPDGKLAFALGSPGGHRIIAFVVKTVIGVIDWGLDIQTAINLPNHTVRRGRVDLERGTKLEAIAPKLRALGHRVRIRGLTSGIQGIARKDGLLMGGADPRREGLALGD